MAVGEREKDDDIIQILTKQIRGALGGVEASEMSRLIIAYEPVWAISRPSADIASALSQTASQCPDTPDHALSAALLIKKIIGNLYGADWATNLPVLYGGSVSEENASDFISQNGISGALVGAASLELEKFVKIIKAAEINE
ncbi:MAG: Triosephosphate isomerase [Parcubacteria group bacterium GW2011_GWC1_43_61]|nr:MAG: Triosephosphate isomerase [Parcubacteria group bacterium GW2011_GWC1_43_61]